MSIEFTQYMLPRGEKRKITIERPDDIEQVAKTFIADGGWFEAEILTTGHVSLTACRMVDGEPEDIEIEVCQNGPDVPLAVDKLVRKTAPREAA